MATSPEKINKSVGKNADKNQVVAEPAKTTEADGFNQDAKVQETAKAETQRNGATARSTGCSWSMCSF